MSHCCSVTVRKSHSIEDDGVLSILGVVTANAAAAAFLHMARRAYLLRYESIRVELETLSATKVEHAAGAEMIGALKRACRAGDAQCALVLCEMGVHPDEAYAARVVPPLMCAARAGRAACVQVLLYKGADVNRRYQNKNALMLACERGHIECAQLLLAAGAETYLPFLSPIAIASCMGHSAIVELLLAYGAEADITSVQLSTTSPVSDWRILKALLQHGGDPNARESESDRAPLARLFWRPGNQPDDVFERAQVLVDAGADVDARDTASGFTVLDRALSLDEPASSRSVEFLLRAGARAHAEDVERVDSQGARLVRLALRPWCCENHHLFHVDQRKRARFLALVGARACARFNRGGHELMHVWMHAVLPLCITRD